MPQAICNNISIEYETFGNPNKPAVLLIMGLGAQMIVWPDRFCQLLAEEGYYVIRFDNRDIGLSTKFDEYGAPRVIKQLFANWFGLRIDAPYNLYHMAHDAVSLLDHLACKKAHIVGASMGGMIAQIIAGLYHDRIISLTSIMSTAHNRGLVMPWNMKLGLQLLKSSQVEHEAEEQFDLKMETVRLISSRTHPPKEQELETRLRKALNRDNEQYGTRRQLSAIVATKKRKKVTKQVNVPTLIIHGDEDQLIPLKFGKKNAEMINNAEFREIEGMGHDFPRPLVGYLAFIVSKHLGKSSEK
jgi:proline iminopeptidase